MKLSLDNHLCFRLYVASRLIIQTYTAEFAPLGLTYPKYLVLMVLADRDGQAVGEMGEALSLDSGTLSPLLKSLRAQGLLRRVRTEGDERRVVNSLTPKGRRVCQQAYDIVYGLFKETGLSDQQFCDLLSRNDDFVQRCRRIRDGRVADVPQNSKVSKKPKSTRVRSSHENPLH